MVKVMARKASVIIIGALLVILLAVAVWFFWPFSKADPWAWKVNYSARYGIWNVLCDDQQVNTRRLERCYLRWVDVYAQRPQFGALFVFIVPEKEGFAVEFHPESGTVFSRDGLSVVHGQKTLWHMRRAHCLEGAECKLMSDEVLAFLGVAMPSEGSLKFSFIDRYDRRFLLDWPLEGFGEAMKDLSRQAVIRQLDK